MSIASKEWIRRLNPLGGDHTAFVDHVRITGSPIGGNGVQWVVSDHLGTPRMILDESGSLGGVKRHDYLPFGEELMSQGLRTASLGYADGDNVRQQFTLKERDIETGLDYFLARYYSSTQGRFTSVDPENAGAVEEEPQSWNAYAYVQNNPLAFVDPEGLERCALSNEDGSCGQWVGDYDGEISTEITGGIFADGAYWNDEQQVWETKEQYERRTWDPQQEFVNETARRTRWMEPYGEIGVDLIPVPGPKIGIIKRVGKAVGLVRVGRHAFTHAWIKRKLFAKLPKLVGEADAKKFQEALKKGVVGPMGESGINVLNSAVGQYTHELKIGGSAQRLLGRVDENGVLVFDKLVRGGLH